MLTHVAILPFLEGRFDADSDIETGSRILENRLARELSGEGLTVIPAGDFGRLVGMWQHDALDLRT